MWNSQINTLKKNSFTLKSKHLGDLNTNAFHAVTLAVYSLTSMLFECWMLLLSCFVGFVSSVHRKKLVNFGFWTDIVCGGFHFLLTLASVVSLLLSLLEYCLFSLKCLMCCGLVFVFYRQESNLVHRRDYAIAVFAFIASLNYNLYLLPIITLLVVLSQPILPSFLYKAMLGFRIVNTTVLNFFISAITNSSEIGIVMSRLEVSSISYLMLMMLLSYHWNA